MRSVLTIPIEGGTLVATLDRPLADPRPTGLLIVSGGNEIRIGAQRGMARLAAALVAKGWPVLRFDRRGVGDSSGINRGYQSSGPDIAAAAQAFRAQGIERIVAFGNCDAATALAIHRGDAPTDALILSNPWVIESHDDLPPAAAIRTHYARRLIDPAAWRALVAGRLDLRGLGRGLAKLARSNESRALADEFAAALSARPLPTTIVLAARDATAIAFANAWKSPAFNDVRDHSAVTCHRIDTASHSYAGHGDFDALLSAVTSVLER